MVWFFERHGRRTRLEVQEVTRNMHEVWFLDANGRGHVERFNEKDAARARQTTILQSLATEGWTQVLYKYCAPDRIDVLRNVRIRFTQPAAFNDPFEARRYFWSVAGCETQVLDRYGQLVEEYQWRPSQAHPLITPWDYDHGYSIQLAIDGRTISGRAVTGQFVRETIHEWYRTHIGVFALSRRVDDVAMWSYYSAAHRGLVIGFEANHQYCSANGVYKIDVMYSNKKGDAIDPSEYGLVGISGVKSKDWEHEAEVRLLRRIGPDCGAAQIVADPKLPTCSIYRPIL